MERKKNPQGSIVISLQTDLEKSKAIATENMSKLQKQVFMKMPEKEQEKILTGYGTVAVDLETGETICKFNMENYRPPKWAIESLARRILSEIQEFYSHEENRRKYEEWKEQQGKDK